MFGGGNGNVSWGECFTCLHTGCTDDWQSGGCLEMLMITNFAGTLAGYGPLGSISMGAACLIISALN